jgi:hypothetical protein
MNKAGVWVCNDPAKFQYPMQLRQAAPLHHALCAGFYYAAILTALAGMKFAVAHIIPATCLSSTVNSGILCQSKYSCF